MKKKTGMFAFSVLLLIGISISILSCKKDDPLDPDPEASSIQSVSGDSQSAEFGHALTNPIEVVVKDKDGKVFSGTTVSFAVTEGSVSPATAKTDSIGKAKTTWTLGPTEGAQTLIATAFKADGTTALTGSPITFTATATQNKATSIELVSGEDQSADAGTVLANSIKILVKDQNGDAFAGAAVNFTVIEGSVSSASEITDSNGNTYVSWTLGSTTGTQALTVKAFKTDGTTALTGSPITVNATALVNEAASIELVSGEDQTADAGTVLTDSIKILVKNQNGDAFVGAVVNFAVTEGSVSSASEITDANGNASVSWTLGSTVGTQALTVTAFKADGTTALTGSPITVNATALVKEAASIELVSGGDQSAMANNTLAEYIVFIVKDASGNPFVGTKINFSITEGNLGATGNSTITGADGMASVSWTLGPTEGTQTLNVTAFKSDETSPLIGSPIVVNATATGLIAEMLYLVDGEDQTGKANTVLSYPIRIKAWGYRNPIEGHTVYFDVAEGSVSPASALTDVYGLVSTTWTLGPTAGTQTLTVTSFEADGTTHLERSPMLINATVEPENETGTVTDYDGNVYQTVKIDEQWWMAENLKVTHLPDGTSIPKVTGDTEWINLAGTDKAYCFENNNDDTEYGAFYTRSAALNGDGSSISDPSGIQGVCPDGWHIPSNAEWKVLTDYRQTTVLKESGTVHWLPPSESNNESGFTAFGAGRRAGYNGTFIELKESGYWWSSDIYTYNGTGVTYRIGYYGGLDKGSNYGVSFDNGNSVRCVKD